MKTFGAYRTLIALALPLICACGKDAPTKPKPPAIGTGFVYSSTRNLTLLEIYSVGLDGSPPTLLTSDSLDDLEPRWSPDGRRVAFIHSYAPGGNQPNVTVMDADGGNPRRLTNDAGDANPSWSPDGTRIAFERNTTFFPRNQLWIINADGTSPVLAIDSLAAHELSWTPQNTFIGIDLFGIVQFNPDGTGQTRILSLDPGTVQSGYPRMSPDGARIVFQWGGASGSDSQIYTVKSDGTDLQQLTSNSGEKVYPTWSPDGLRIGFSRRENGLSIWVMDADGSNQTRVTPPPGDDYLGAWR